jgi:hypothetical protein
MQRPRRSLILFWVSRMQKHDLVAAAIDARSRAAVPGQPALPGSDFVRPSAMSRLLRYNLKAPARSACAHLTSNQASAMTEPTFGERPVQGFFNTAHFFRIGTDQEGRLRVGSSLPRLVKTTR